MERKLKKILNEAANQYNFPNTLDIQSIVTKKKKSSKRLTFILSPVIACLLVLSFIGLKFDNPDENPVVKTIEHNFVINPENPKELVGFSHNVFIGKVISKDGTKNLDGLPETQFNVEVIQNIKGDLKGTIKVNQQGGYMKEELILLQGDKLLEEDKEYLFVTRYLEEEDWYTLIPQYGDILIINGQQKAELIDKFTKAYKEEIPFKFDEKSTNLINKQ